jgi:hypothetical protein
VTLDPVPIVVACARKSDQPPSRHVTIAAIDGIGEKSLLRVLQEQREELRAVGAFERDRSRLEAGEHLVLVLRPELPE